MFFGIAFLLTWIGSEVITAILGNGTYITLGIVACSISLFFIANYLTDKYHSID